MIQYGPTTGQFAAYRETQKIACKDILASLQAVEGYEGDKARATIIMVGIQVINLLRQEATRMTDDPGTADIVIQACLAGYGWAGVAEFYKLDEGYISTLDTINNLNVKGDNDIPPTKEKG